MLEESYLNRLPGHEEVVPFINSDAFALMEGRTDEILNRCEKILNYRHGATPYAVFWFIGSARQINVSLVWFGLKDESYYRLAKKYKATTLDSVMSFKISSSKISEFM